MHQLQAFSLLCERHSSPVTGSLCEFKWHRENSVKAGEVVISTEAEQRESDEERQGKFQLFLTS